MMSDNSVYARVAADARDAIICIPDGTFRSVPEYYAIMEGRVAAVITSHELLVNDNNMLSARILICDMAVPLRIDTYKYNDVIGDERYESVSSVLCDVFQSDIGSIISEYSRDAICKARIVFDNYVGYECDVYDLPTSCFPSDPIPTISIPYTCVSLVLSDFSEFREKPRNCRLILKQIILPGDDRDMLASARLNIPAYKISASDGSAWPFDA
jgi:hypothetical protein